MTYSVHEAKTQFSKLLDLVEAGERGVIIRRGKPVAELVGSKPKPKPLLGALKDEPMWPEGWDKAWTDSEVADFYKGRD